MKCKSPMTRICLTWPIVAAAVYMAAYLALVKPEPVYYGNRLKQLSLTVLTAPDGSTRCSFRTVSERGTVPLFLADAEKSGQSPTALTPERAPDAYRVAYRVNSPLVARLFVPAQWLDSKLRPSQWPPLQPYC
jgi:hypothetical protein